MITAGIDMGIQYIKAVIVRDGRVIAMDRGRSGGAGRGKAAEEVWQAALREAGLSAGEVDNVVATGQGKFDVAFARDNVVEPVADARAARFLYPDARAVVDIGADQVRVVTLGAGDAITEVVMNQKCAAGLGIFLMSMARMLDMTLDEMGALSGSPAGGVVVNDGCAVFAEMDALGLLNRNVSREEVARAVLQAATVRINSVLNDKIRPPKDATVLVGGASKNTALVDALQKRSEIRFLIPERAEYAGALGAALIAAG